MDHDVELGRHILTHFLSDLKKHLAISKKKTLNNFSTWLAKNVTPFLFIDSSKTFFFFLHCEATAAKHLQHILVAYLYLQYSGCCDSFIFHDKFYNTGLLIMNKTFVCVAQHIALDANEWQRTQGDSTGNEASWWSKCKRSSTKSAAPEFCTHSRKVWRDLLMNLDAHPPY